MDWPRAPWGSQEALLLPPLLPPPPHPCFSSRLPFARLSCLLPRCLPRLLPRFLPRFLSRLPSLDSPGWPITWATAPPPFLKSPLRKVVVTCANFQPIGPQASQGFLLSGPRVMHPRHARTPFGLHSLNPSEWTGCRDEERERGEEEQQEQKKKKKEVGCRDQTYRVRMRIPRYSAVW